MNEAARPGNANLPIGETAKGIKENANREIGVPRGGPGHRNPVKAGLVARPEDWRRGVAHILGTPISRSALAPDANSPAGSAPDANQEIGVPKRQP